MGQKGSMAGAHFHTKAYEVWRTSVAFFCLLNTRLLFTRGNRSSQSPEDSQGTGYGAGYTVHHVQSWHPSHVCTMQLGTDPSQSNHISFKRSGTWNVGKERVSHSCTMSLRVIHRIGATRSCTSCHIQWAQLHQKRIGAHTKRKQKQKQKAETNITWEVEWEIWSWWHHLNPWMHLWLKPLFGWTDCKSRKWLLMSPRPPHSHLQAWQVGKKVFKKEGSYCAKSQEKNLVLGQPSRVDGTRRRSGRSCRERMREMTGHTPVI